MNQLADATSPYLLQHADNPVDWMPWSQQAFILAREQDKPVLLSIGYSACHWCHVMAHESFEDEETAELMNRLYINIKVDREQRPDLDKIYQQAHSALTERPGGWPLTVFLNPHDQMPIYAGTYFPPQPRHGLPSFRQLLEQIADVYRHRREDIEHQSTSLRSFFDQQNRQPPYRHNLTAMPLDICASQIKQQFDPHHGGFSPPPKFPHPGILHFALRRSQSGADNGRTDKRLLHCALFSLQKMCMGGVFDQVGGGFFRYSTDAQWMIPHFEKMLYDNGPLLALCAQAWCLSGQPLYRDTAHAIAEWVMRDMQSPQGGYWSALDADSEDGEGAYYLWTKAQLQALIPADEWPIFAACFGLDHEANFAGKWHLHSSGDIEQIHQQFSLSEEILHKKLKKHRQRLFTARTQRPSPACDDKVLTAWNGLMIQGMACAGRLLQQPLYTESANRATAFVQQNLWRDQRLLVSYRKGSADFNATLDDYAFMLHALLELLQSDWQTRWLQWAMELADALLTHFEDTRSGGFFFTSDDHEPLIQRSKNFADESMPAGNAIATLCLQRLGYLVGESRYLQAAENALRAAWPAIDSHAMAHCSMLDALQEFLQPPTLVILRGNREAVAPWRQLSDRPTLPDLLTFHCPDTEEQHAQSLRSKPLIGEVCAYICQGHHCQPPITTLANWRHWLAERARLMERANSPSP